MEEKLKFLTRVKISIFKVRDYSVFINESLNKAMKYLIILSIIVGTVLGIVQVTILNGVEKSTKTLLQQENFKFEMIENVLDFKSSPFKQEEGADIVIIDTNKSLVDLESVRYITVHKDRSVMFFKDGISTIFNGNEYNLKYSEIPFMKEYLNNEIVLDAINSTSSIKYISILVMILVTYIVAIFNSFFISLVGILSSKMSGLNLRYKDILKLSIYSTTLITIMKVIVPIGRISVIVSSIYLVIAINMIAKKNKQVN